MEITRELVIPCLCSFIACCAFGVQFNIRIHHLIAAAVGSTVSQVIYMLLSNRELFDNHELSAVKCYFIAAAAVSVYSEIMARCLKAPVNMYLIVGIIPLVPGGLTYYTMLALVMGDGDTFIDRATDALSAAFAIAMGIFAVSSAIRIGTAIYKDIGGKRDGSGKNEKKSRPKTKKSLKNI